MNIWDTVRNALRSSSDDAGVWIPIATAEDHPPMGAGEDFPAEHLYTDEKLKRLASVYDPEFFAAPVVTTFPEPGDAHTRGEHFPRVAKISRLKWIPGQRTLYSLWTGLTDRLRDAVRSGITKASINIFPKVGQLGGAAYLRHVALVTSPGIPGLPDISAHLRTAQDYGRAAHDLADAASFAREAHPDTLAAIRAALETNMKADPKKKTEDAEEKAEDAAAPPAADAPAEETDEEPERAAKPKAPAADPTVELTRAVGLLAKQIERGQKAVEARLAAIEAERKAERKAAEEAAGQQRLVDLGAIADELVARGVMPPTFRDGQVAAWAVLDDNAVKAQVETWRATGSFMGQAREKMRMVRTEKGELQPAELPRDIAALELDGYQIDEGSVQRFFAARSAVDPKATPLDRHRQLVEAFDASHGVTRGSGRI